MGLQRTFLVRVFLFALLSICLASASFATTIGLYTDASGSSCSFSGNNTGLVSAYVVVRPDGDGVRAVRFAAPLPACFHAVWVGDVVPDGVVSIGDSQTGISLATNSCSLLPESVLQIFYSQSGGTTPCCAFPIVADPGSGTIEATTCVFGTNIATPITSHMNADATCPCNDAVAPMPPSDPSPQDLVTGVIEWPTFTWTGQDWDGDLASFDVYLGMTTDPPLVATVTTPTHELSGPLAPFGHYYWRVVAHDAQGHQTSGPLWSFTVGKHNNPPSISLVSPALGSSNNPVSISLTWAASDPDGNIMVYDVYLGTTDPPPFVATRSTMQYNTVLNLNYDTMYYWRVVARDAPHSETSSPTFNFRTRIFNPAPLAASDPSPANNALNVSSGADLAWTAQDPDGEAVHCDVLLGTNPNSLPVVATNVVPFANHRGTFDPGVLASNTVYYWRIVITDARGASTNGPVWVFSTGGNHPPNAPLLLAPADNAVNQPLDVTLSWSATDPDPGQALRYDVYVGTDPSPVLAFSLLQSTSVTYHTNLGNTRFYWKVIAKDPLGEQAASVVRSFTTRLETTNHPPTTPSDPIPPDGGFAGAGGVTLQWTSTDPDGTPLTFIVFFGTTNPPSPFSPVGSTSQPSFQVGPLVRGQHYYWMIAASDGVFGVSGPVWSFTADSPLPVLFSRFDAAVKGAAARVRWELQSDEAMESYTLLRRVKGAAQFASIASLHADGSDGEYLDRTVEGGKTYQYQLMVRTAGGNEFRSQAATIEMPSLELALGQNHPNPFNPQTTIPYVLPASESPVRVRVVIYDTGGRTVRVLVDENQGGGAHEVVWNGDDASGSIVSSGIYLCVLQAGKERRTQKLVLLK